MEEEKYCQRCGLILAAYTVGGICNFCEKYNDMYITPQDTTLYVINKFPPTKWKWSLCDSKDVEFHVHDAPNWFHRFMQKILLGIHWIRK